MIRSIALPLAALLLATSAPMAAAGRSFAPAIGSRITTADFFDPGLAPVRHSRGYDVTIVYFMDYECPSCRQYSPDVKRVLDGDRRVRLIYRDTPMISPRSDAAAYAAIAASFQGRHEAFHEALMATKGPADEVAIRVAAARSGVDWARLQQDLTTRHDDIMMVIARNFELATEVGIVGTPAFIIGNSQSNGALDYAALKAEIADARKLAPGPDVADRGESPPKSPDGEQPGEVPGNAASGNKPTAVRPALFETSEPADSEAGSSGGWRLLAVLLGLAVAVMVVFLFCRRQQSARPTDK